MDSPLLFPVKLKDSVIYVLDETAIPYKEEYIEVVNLEQAQDVLRQMKTRSLGQVLLFFYSCILFKTTHNPQQLAKVFKDNRPTFDFFMLAYIIDSEVKKGLTIEKAVEGFIFGFDRLRQKRAQILAQLLPNPAKIATICNVNGELIYLYQQLKKIGNEASFIVCETRPYLQGTRLTFWELTKNNIPVKIICDNQIALIMQEGLVNCVVTGADRATTKGDVINKIGTYPLARFAKYFNIPFYPLTQYPRDIDIDNIEIEQRPKEEVFMYLSRDYSQIEAIYPAFDITKSDYVTKPMDLFMGGK